MFSVRKPAIIIVLIALLVVTGYLNHNFTKQALSKVSNDYQKYEEMELVKGGYLDDNHLIPTISDDDKSDESDQMEIYDTILDENIDSILETSEKSIEETLGGNKISSSLDYFVEQRLSRDKLRAELIHRLNEIVNNDNTNDEMREKAQDKIMKIGDISEKELTIESLIRAKGFEEVLTFITDDSAKVIVSVDELGEQEMVQILDTVVTETNLATSNIKIMKKD